MKVLSGIIGSIVRLLTKRGRNEKDISARIKTLSGLLYVSRIPLGGMDD
jgi:hypothetical protein